MLLQSLEPSKIIYRLICVLQWVATGHWANCLSNAMLKLFKAVSFRALEID